MFDYFDALNTPPKMKIDDQSPRIAVVLREDLPEVETASLHTKMDKLDKNITELNNRLLHIEHEIKTNESEKRKAFDTVNILLRKLYAYGICIWNGILCIFV